MNAPNTLTIHAEPQRVSHQPRVQFDETQLSLLKNTICRGATDDEFALFVQVAQRTGLDPFARQIHAVKRWDNNLGREVMAIQTGVDGFRLIAQRTGAYKGQTAPEWCGDDMVWHPVWLSDTAPSAARIGVHREGFLEPAYGVARWKSYAQKKKSGEIFAMWSKMPDVMLAKCAECQALRKAFPQEMYGLYADEEMPAPEEPKREKLNTDGEVMRKKPKWEQADIDKGAPQRAKFQPIGGEQWYLCNWRRMGYDEPAKVIAWYQERLDKWSDELATEAAGYVKSIFAAGMDKEMDRLSPSWDFSQPTEIIDGLAAILRQAEG